MACLNPIRAYRHRTGSHIMWRRPSDALLPFFSPFPVPCGKCYGCKLEYSRQWAVRMMLESQLHTFNYFLTLTYDPEHLPNPPSISKKDLQDFHKRLRIHYSRQHQHVGIRYYCCGEYGEQLGRPHYHGIYFNMFIPDLQLLKVKDGFNYYYSDTINQIWGKGFVTIANVSFLSCGYVSRYVTKKVDSHKNHKRRKTFEANNLVPEFSLMSKNPAIGLDWLIKNWQDVYRDDFVVLDGRKIKPPKYFDNVVREESKSFYPEFWEKIKRNRLDNRIVYEDDYYDVRLPSIRKIAKERFKKFIRELEKEQ